MTAVGVAVMFFGIFLMYDAYKAIHGHVTAAPVTSLKTALP